MISSFYSNDVSVSDILSAIQMAMFNCQIFKEVGYGTNRILGGYAPSIYLNRIERDNKVREIELNNHIKCHIK